MRATRFTRGTIRTLSDSCRTTRGPGRSHLITPFGRPRGGLTTKIHLVSDGQARALAFVLTGGQIADTSMFTGVLDDIHVSGHGRLRERGIKITTPERDDQIAKRRKRPGRPINFGNEQQKRHKGRNVIERCFSFVKQREDSRLATTRPPAHTRPDSASPQPSNGFSNTA